MLWVASMPRGHLRSRRAFAFSLNFCLLFLCGTTLHIPVLGFLQKPKSRNLTSGLSLLTCVLSLFTCRKSFPSMNLVTLASTRSAARWLLQKIIISSAYLTNLCPRSTSSWSSSLSRLFASTGLTAELCAPLLLPQCYSKYARATVAVRFPLFSTVLFTAQFNSAYFYTFNISALR